MRTYLFVLLSLLVSYKVNAKLEIYDYEVKKISYKNLVANLYLPKGLENVAAVIVVGGSSGGMRNEKGELLAQYGIAVLTLAYFKDKNLPSTLDGISIEYALSAIDFLQTVSSIDSSKIGFLGSSRGSELAFLVASNDERIKSLVVTTPSKVAWHGMATSTAWKFRGEDIYSLAFNKEQLLPYIERTQQALLNIDKVKAAQFSFEKINGPILLISAEKDHIWPSYQMSKDIEEYLLRNDFKFSVTHDSYPTGHFFSKETLPAISTSIVNHFVTTLMDLPK